MLLPKSFEISERNTGIFLRLAELKLLFLFYCCNNFNTDQYKHFHLIWGQHGCYQEEHMPGCSKHDTGGLQNYQEY